MLSIDLNGKKALVSGVCRGIGAGIARQLAKAGCDVAGWHDDGQRWDVVGGTVEWRKSRALEAEKRKNASNHFSLGFTGNFLRLRRNQSGCFVHHLGASVLARICAAP